MLGIEVGDSEDGAFWTAFFKGLRARGLSGVELVISITTWAQVRHRSRLHRGGLATLPGVLHAQRLVQGAESLGRDGGGQDELVPPSRRQQERIAAATISAEALGTLAKTLRMKCTRQRCQAAPMKTASMADLSPRW